MTMEAALERTAEEWEELGIEEYEILAASVYQEEILGEGYEFSANDFRDHYCGEFETPADYAEQQIENAGQIDLDTDLFNGWGTLRYYIDFADMADDLDKNGMYFLESPAGGVFVFDA